MEKERINIKCPRCGQALAILKPAKPGMYQLTCNKCNHLFKLQLRGVPIRMEESTKPETKNSSVQKKVKVLGMPKLYSDNKYRITEPALINHPYGCVCPKCQKALVFLPRQEGMMAVKCDRCATSIIFKAVSACSKIAEESADTSQKQERPDTGEKPSKEEQPVPTQKVRQKTNKSIGMLSWGNIFKRQKYVLREGKNVIGRQDQESPSDAEVKDNKASRRSIEIDVTKKDEGYFFKLTVKKAANPVYVNYKEICEGESIYLKYRDVIQLGQTLINFSEIKK